MKAMDYAVVEAIQKRVGNTHQWSHLLGPVQLWFEFLKLSPSYELARRKSEGLEIGEAELPNDFGDVCDTFNKLGDVRSARFSEWWGTRGREHIDFPDAEARVCAIETLRVGHEDVAAVALSEFGQNEWMETGRPATVLIAVPVTMPAHLAARQVATLLTKRRRTHSESRKTDRPFAVSRDRFDGAAIARCLEAVWVKALLPKFRLWQIGSIAHVSKTYSKELQYDQTYGPKQNTYDRQVLGVITSRALKRANRIAENAARGRFPSHAPREHDLPFDYNDLAAHLSGRFGFGASMAENSG